MHPDNELAVDAKERKRKRGTKLKNTVASASSFFTRKGASTQHFDSVLKRTKVSLSSLHVWAEHFLPKSFFSDERLRSVLQSTFDLDERLARRTTSVNC